MPGFYASHRILLVPAVRCALLVHRSSSRSARPGVRAAPARAGEPASALWQPGRSRCFALSAPDVVCVVRLLTYEVLVSRLPEWGGLYR
jgi:hypothetical protein